MRNGKEKGDDKDAVRVRVNSSLDKNVDQASTVDEFFEEWGEQNCLNRCEVYLCVRNSCHSSEDLEDLPREQNRVQEKRVYYCFHSVVVHAEPKPLDDAHLGSLIAVCPPNKEYTCNQTQGPDTSGPLQAQIVFELLPFCLLQLMWLLFL